jgi:hypothetical protein
MHYCKSAVDFLRDKRVEPAQICVEPTHINAVFQYLTDWTYTT